MSVKFATIASGSSGNSVFVGTENTKILIDAGLSGKRIEDGLKQLDLSGKDIDAIFVTHEHIDHVDGIGVLSRRYDLPIYATEGTWNKMPSKVGEIREKNKRLIYSDENCILNDLCIHPFEIPHDAAEPVGYTVSTDKAKIAVATDIGHVTRTILDNIKECDTILLESNHDVEMLKNGSYPYPLKQRVLGSFGHLSNDTAGKLLACIMNDKLKYAFLGHLSKENNTPKLAYDTVKAVLKEYGIDTGTYFKMFTAARYGVENPIVI